MPSILKKQLSILFRDVELYEKAAGAAAGFVYSQKGSTQKIMDYIQANRLLTSL
jgi:3-deoxy-D-manno-octulosonic-acid transferase